MLNRKEKLSVMSKYKKQLDELLREWNKTPESEIPTTIIQEAERINNTIKIIDGRTPVEEKRINFKFNEDDARNFELLTTWIMSNREELNLKEKTSVADEFRFLLNFFISSIIYVPENAGLSPEVLTGKIKKMTRINKGDRSVEYKLEDILNIVSLIASMQIQVNSLPFDESRSLTSAAIEKLQSELKTNSQFQSALESYREARRIDKQNLSRKIDDEV